LNKTISFNVAFLVEGMQVEFVQEVFKQ